MAQLRLQPPELFNFRNPDDWPRWKRRFEQFRVASGLVDDDASKQISTLLYCIGEEAEAVLISTNITEDERKVYDTVIAKLDAFFKVRRNIIFERARFNRRNQLEGESAEQYIMELYKLAENCNYGDMKTEMIRDRLVVGIRDTVLSRHLQLDADLTLETAKKKNPPERGNRRTATSPKRDKWRLQNFAASSCPTPPGVHCKDNTSEPGGAVHSLPPLKRDFMGLLNNHSMLLDNSGERLLTTTKE